MDISPSEFQQWRTYIHNVCGVKINEHKQYLISQRLAPIARAADCATLAHLYQKVTNGYGPQLVNSVINAVTTHETSFFRDTHPFVTLKERILPACIEQLRLQQLETNSFTSKIRIWCVAASSGQEPYSIAMCLDEFLNSGPLKTVSKDNFHILATDIANNVLLQAQKAIYDGFEIKRGLDSLRKRKYFSKHDDGWHLNKEIRDMVEFKEINLSRPLALFDSYHLIVCRNVLIYFDQQTRVNLLRKFHQLLTPHGVLLLGSTENAYDLPDLFESQRHGMTLFYQKKSASHCVSLAPQ